MQALGEDLQNRLDDWHPPPVDVLFVHRKLGGMFMLASRMGVALDLRALVVPFIDEL